MMLTPRARNTAIAAAIAFKLGYIGLAAIFGFAFGLCSRVRF